MKHVKLLKDQLIGTHVFPAGEIVPVEDQRADAMVKKNHAVPVSTLLPPMEKATAKPVVEVSDEPKTKKKS